MNKLFHSRRRKHAPFGVVPLSEELKKLNIHGTHGKIVKSYDRKHEYDRYNEPEDFNPEQYFKQSRKNHSISNIDSFETDSQLSVITPAGIQTVGEYRRQLMAAKKLQNQNSLVTSNSAPQMKSSIVGNSDNLRYEFSHNPEE